MFFCQCLFNVYTYEHVRMYVCIYVSYMHVQVYMYHICMHVCMYVCMYVGMYVLALKILSGVHVCCIECLLH